MWLDEEKNVFKRDLAFNPPILNTSGMLGFVPDLHTISGISGLGAFITNPISHKPRKPAANRAWIPFSGGFLLHNGHPNPGITRAIVRYQRRWAAAPVPIIIHLLAESPDTLAWMVRKIEGLENILALELGLHPECDAAALVALMESAQGELPVIPCVNPEQAVRLLSSLKDLQPSAVHLVEPRGALPGPDGEIVMGRLYGPGIFPVMLGAARGLIQAGFRVIANGGITDHWQVDALLNAGATAVGLGSALWGVTQDALFPHFKP